MALAETTARPDFAVAEVSRFDASGQPLHVWAHPEGRLWTAAFGEADRREGLSLRSVLGALDAPWHDLPEGMPGPWFGAAAFDGRAWEGFSPLRFTLPALLLWSDGARHFAAAFGDGAHRRLEETRRKLEGAILSSGPDITPARRLRYPAERERWNALVSRALTALAAGTLEKVVVARAVDVEAGGRIDPAAVLARLERRHPACRAFLVRGERGATFVAAALHPTPAVLGVPSAAARRFLAEHEGLDRGLYTGLVGWVGPRSSELAVALRCALIRGNRARLFVGAGIVEGSSAEREWLETELKARALLDALGAEP